jgi:hypothetical protein
MNRTSTPVVATLVAIGLAAIFGCSGGGGATPTPTCFTAPYGDACTACMQSSCASQLESIGDQCASYLACACPAGTYSAPSASCDQWLSDTNPCGGVYGVFQLCLVDHCDVECATSGDGGPPSESSCFFEAKSICNEVRVPNSAVTSEAQGCVASGGTAGAVCPTAGLLGCCKEPALTLSDTCRYSADGLTSYQQACVSGGGTWSSTP